MERFKKTLKESNILPKQQFGFVENYSTTYHLSQITEYINKNSNKGYSIGAIFFNVAKAFDKV